MSWMVPTGSGLVLVEALLLVLVGGGATSRPRPAAQRPSMPRGGPRDSHLADVVIDGMGVSVVWLRPLLLVAELRHGHAHAVRVVRRLSPVGRHRLRRKESVSTLAR